ncbi:hypothetical protein V8E53_003519 [Lactarius tabidus]
MWKKPLSTIEKKHFRRHEYNEDDSCAHPLLHQASGKTESAVLMTSPSQELPGRQANCSNIRRCSPLASTLLDVGRQYTLRSQLEDPGQGQYFGALHSLVPGARSAIGSVPESDFQVKVVILRHNLRGWRGRWNRASGRGVPKEEAEDESQAGSAARSQAQGQGAELSNSGDLSVSPESAFGFCAFMPQSLSAIWDNAHGQGSIFNRHLRKTPTLPFISEHLGSSRLTGGNTRILLGHSASFSFSFSTDVAATLPMSFWYCWGTCMVEGKSGSHIDDAMRELHEPWVSMTRHLDEMRAKSSSDCGLPFPLRVARDSE